jgi:hypothetical protein
VSVSPADDATSIAQATSVTVMFSGPMDRNTIDTASFSLREGINNIEGAVTLMPDGTTAVFQPDNPLEDNTLYTVSLLKDITDTYGQPLFGNQPDETFISKFTTVDNAPPPLPEAGQITLSIPEDNTTEIRGTQGTVEPGTIVFIFNLTQGINTGAQAGEDGSFYASLSAQSHDIIAIVLQDAEGNRTPLPLIPFSDNEGTTILGPQGGEMISLNGVHVSVLPKAMIRSDAVRLTDVPLEELPNNLSSGFTAVQAFHIDVSEAIFNTIQSLKVEERNNRFSGSAVYNTPLSISATHVSADSVGPALQFGFTAKSVDISGTEQAVTVSANGSSTPCTSQDTAEFDTSAPRLSLTAPSCLAPSQAFSLAANAVQPRFDVWIDAPEGSQEGDVFLILRPIIAGDETFWMVEETATCKIIGTSLRVETISKTPWGIRDSGDYLIVRADAPLALIEGIVTGEEALVGTNLTSLVAMTDGNNGAFLLPVPADQDFELQVRLPEDGSMSSSTTIASINVNETVQVGAVGPDAPEPLTVSVDFGHNEFVSSNSRIIFSFSQQLDTKTIVPTSLFITNSQGQKVEGSLTPVGSMQVVFSPKTAWMMGQTYTYVVTTHVRAENGAHLIQDATGTFTGFTPTILGQVSGTDVKDAVAIGTRAYFLDSSNLRCIDLFDPAQPSEGTTAILNPVPNRITSLVSDTTTALIVSAGSVSDYGKLTLFDLGNPMAPSNSGSLLVSTPSGSSAITGVPEQTAIPGSIASLDIQIILSSKGIGLQSLALDTIVGADSSGPGDAMLQYPLEGNISFTDIASFAPYLVSTGPDGLQIHDAETLAPIATAAVNGTPFDVEVVQVKGRVLAIVAAGLSGGVQVFEISSEGQLNPIAQVLPGCSVTRIAADGPMNRAWLWCSNQRLMSLDLSHVDGMQEIDANGDGTDDRLGGSISLPISLKEITLDRPRALALIAAGPEGLHTLQLGPAEAVITDVRRDPVPGDFDDEESILSTGMAYSGDHQLFVTLETRIPPGHSGLRAVVESEGADVPVVFPGEGTVQILQAGANELILEPATLDEDESIAFTIKVVDAEDRSIASYGGTLNTVPIDTVSWSRPTQDRYLVDTSDPMDLVILGRSDSGRYFNISALVEYSVGSSVIGSISSDGKFEGQAGGTTEVYYEINGQRGRFDITSTLPPALTKLHVDPYQIFIREPGGTIQLSFIGTYSDGTTQPVTYSDGIALLSSDPEVAAVDEKGIVSAISEGTCEIQASFNDLKGISHAHISYYVPPVLSEIVLDIDKTEIPTDEGTLPVRAWVRGTGSLGSLSVTFRVNGLGDQMPEVVINTRSNGLVATVIRGFELAGTGDLIASVVNPENGETLSTSVPITVVERNRDAEPNNTLATAVLVSRNYRLTGQVNSSADSVDVYRLDLMQEGTLTPTLILSDENEYQVHLKISDVSGATLAEDSSSSSELSLTVEVPAESVYLLITAEIGVANYSLNLDFEAATPHINSITPDSGQAGDVVMIEGRGFSLNAIRNVVKFHGVISEVVAAESTRLQVVVPAYATDGPVMVSTGSHISNEFPFITGVQGDPNDNAFFISPSANQYREDLVSPHTIIGNRIEIAFKHSVRRSSIEAIAQELNATIVGLWPTANFYTFEFADVNTLSDLYDLLTNIRQRDEVIAAGVIYPHYNESGFFVAMRDNYKDSCDIAAFEQINMFKAWDTVINSGYFNVGVFNDSTQFPRVTVAILDEVFYQNPNNKEQFPDTIFSKKDMYDEGYCLNDVTLGESKSHGTAVAGIIGALNVDDNIIRTSGILGGLLPCGADPYYELICYEACKEENAKGETVINANEEERCAIRGCRGDETGTICSPQFKLDFDILNLSYGLLMPDPLETPTNEDIDKYAADYPVATRADAIWQIQQKRREVIYWEELRYQNLFIVRSNMLVVAAAGNENHDARYNYPSAMTRNGVVGDRVLSVVATAQGFDYGGSSGVEIRLADGTPDDNGADSRAAFSNFGRAVDIAAPGTGVLTVDDTQEGDSKAYSTINGTSAAAPMVSGVAALLKALDDTLTAEKIKQRLINTATPIDSIPPPQVYDKDGGIAHLDWGNWPKPCRLDALAAVQKTLKELGTPSSSSSSPYPSWINPSPDSNTPPFVPGKKRFLWTVDSAADKLIRVQLLKGFEQDHAKFINPPKETDISSYNCSNPVGLAVSPSGDKVYIACRGSNAILVWNANTMEPVPLEDGTNKIDLSVNGLTFPGNNIKMAISPDGHYLVVPVNGKALALIDIWQDRFINTIYIQGSNIIGQFCAVAFDKESNLFAVSSKGRSIWPGSSAPSPTGTLIRLSHDEWRLLSLSATPQNETLLIGDPRGLSIQRNENGAEYIYVYYGGSPVSYAVTVHLPETLSEIGKISDNVQGRTGPGLAPGRIIPGMSPSKDTGTERAFDMVIDESTGEKAYILYYWTGNIGLLEPAPNSQSNIFHHMKAATEVNGNFDIANWNSLDPQIDLHPTTGYGFQVGLANFGLTWSATRMVDNWQYLSDSFPVAMDMDQQGELIATAFTGDGGLVRMFFASKMDEAFANMTSSSSNPAITPLEDVDNNINIRYDLMDTLISPRDIAFEPQISIISPGDGKTVHGAISANVIIRDAEIEFVTCEILDLSGNVLNYVDQALSSGVGGERETGVIRTFIFPNNMSGSYFLPTGEYDLKATAIKLGASFNTRIRFQYKQGVEVVNYPPKAFYKTAKTGEDVPVGITIDGTDPDGDPLTYIVVKPPSHGTLSGTAPTFTYTPDPGYWGPDDFRFKVNDGTVDSNTATVTIDINAKPITRNDVASVNEGGSEIIDIWNNDEDPDGSIQIQTVMLSTRTWPCGDAILITVFGVVSFVPSTTLGCHGQYEFTYTVQDNENLESDSATVTIEVNARPIANNDEAVTAAGLPVVIDVTANDSDIDGTVDKSTVVIQQAPTNGTASVSGGLINYTPVSGGIVSFSYTVSDNDGCVSDPGIVTVYVVAGGINGLVITQIDTSTNSVTVCNQATYSMPIDNFRIDGVSLGNGLLQPSGCVTATIPTSSSGIIQLTFGGSLIDFINLNLAYNGAGSGNTLIRISNTGNDLVDYVWQ